MKMLNKPKGARLKYALTAYLDDCEEKQKLLRTLEINLANKKWQRK